MQIVIDIPEEWFDDMVKEEFTKVDELCRAIQLGTALPEKHGRLKDVDWIDDNCPDYRTEDGAWCYKWNDIDEAPTIIKENED